MPERRTLDAPYDLPPRHVEFNWLGPVDRGLWNWLHVKAPNDATATELALALFGNPCPATGLTMAGRYAGVPAAWAARLSGARMYRPESFSPPRSMIEQLANSSLADALALEQARDEANKFPRAGLRILAPIALRSSVRSP